MFFNLFSKIVPKCSQNFPNIFNKNPKMSQNKRATSVHFLVRALHDRSSEHLNIASRLRIPYYRNHAACAFPCDKWNAALRCLGIHLDPAACAAYRWGLPLVHPPGTFRSRISLHGPCRLRIPLLQMECRFALLARLRSLSILDGPCRLRIPWTVLLAHPPGACRLHIPRGLLFVAWCCLHAPLRSAACASPWGLLLAHLAGTCGLRIPLEPAAWACPWNLPLAHPSGPCPSLIKQSDSL
jgi:hypothetical protein